MRFLHAEGETHLQAEGDGAPVVPSDRVVVSFGPDHAPLEQRQIALTIEDAQKLVPKPTLIVFAAFQFDPEASKDIDELNWPGVTLLKAQMNVDLLTDDLKKKRASNESFWLIGQPDVTVENPSANTAEGEYRISVHEFDYFNIERREISNPAMRIRLQCGCWTAIMMAAACFQDRCSFVRILSYRQRGKGFRSAQT